MVEAKNYRAQSDSRVGLWANFKGRQKLDVSSRPREVSEQKWAGQQKLELNREKFDKTRKIIITL